MTKRNPTTGFDEFDPGECLFLTSRIERLVKPSTKVRASEDRVPDDCVIDLTRISTVKNPMASYASLQYSAYPNGPALVASDIPVRRGTRSAKIHKLIETVARSCDLEDVHSHEVGHADLENKDQPPGHYEHFHLSDCSLADLGKVLKEAGY